MALSGGSERDARAMAAPIWNLIIVNLTLSNVDHGVDSIQTVGRWLAAGHASAQGGEK